MPRECPLHFSQKQRKRSKDILRPPLCMDLEICSLATYLIGKFTTGFSDRALKSGYVYLVGDISLQKPFKAMKSPELEGLLISLGTTSVRLWKDNLLRASPSPEAAENPSLSFKFCLWIHVVTLLATRHRASFRKNMPIIIINATY